MSTVVKKQSEVRPFPKLVETQNTPARTDIFLNRELSLLKFHARVLEEAFDDRNPLLERLKFLSIFNSNLDEFFMIRVSGLKQEIEEEIDAVSADGQSPEQQLKKVREQVLLLTQQQSKVWLEDLQPRLAKDGLELAQYDSLTVHEKETLNNYFSEHVYPILTPLAVDPSHPFPYISPLSVNICLIVEPPTDPPYFGALKFDEPKFVRIKVPSVVPRLISVNESNTKFVLLEEIIEANIRSLFPGVIPGPCYRFRVTRDADIEIREEEAHDLLSQIQEELRQRRFGTPVRLEVSPNMPEEMIDYLVESLKLDKDDVYQVDGPLHTQDLMLLFDQDRSDLKDVPFEPVVPEWFKEYPNIFEAISERDRMLHHPYDSYDGVTEFINQAVDDDDVVAIKICLYRTGPDSPIPPALIRASEKGKQVTALIELKARFDEEHNIEWARKLDQAGVHVVYGILGLKTHGKLTLVMRREGDRLRKYVHIASGN